MELMRRVVLDLTWKLTWEQLGDTDVWEPDASPRREAA
jgi:hypothetical protein